MKRGEGGKQTMARGVRPRTGWGESDQARRWGKVTKQRRGRSQMTREGDSIGQKESDQAKGEESGQARGGE